MNKTLIQSVLLTSVFTLAACSNDDDKKTPADGGAVFLHAIPDVGTIYLDGAERPFGAVNYGKATPAVALRGGDWDVDVEQWNASNPSANQLLLDATFNVTSGLTNLFVLSGTFASPELIKVDLGKDTETADDDKSAIFLNVAHAQPDAGDVDIYFLQDGEVLADVSADATLSYKSVSDDFRLTTAKQTLVVTVAGSKDVLFNSGERDLIDANYQSIVLGANPDENEDVTAYYYYVTGGDIWRSNEGVSYVRFFNAVQDSDIADVTTTIAEESDKSIVEDVCGSTGCSGAKAALARGEASGYFEIPADLYSFDTGVITSKIYVASGIKETVAVIGRVADGVDAIEVIKISDQQQQIANEVNVTVTHMGYKTDIEDLENYNVHLIDDGVDLTTRAAELAALQFKETGNISADNGRFELLVMNASNTIEKAKLSVELVDGENRQFAIIQQDSGEGLELVEITD